MTLLRPTNLLFFSPGMICKQHMRPPGAPISAALNTYCQMSRDVFVHYREHSSFYWPRRLITYVWPNLDYNENKSQKHMYWACERFHIHVLLPCKNGMFSRKGYFGIKQLAPFIGIILALVRICTCATKYALHDVVSTAGTDQVP